MTEQEQKRQKEIDKVVKRIEEGTLSVDNAMYQLEEITNNRKMRAVVDTVEVAVSANQLQNSLLLKSNKDELVEDTDLLFCIRKIIGTDECNGAKVHLKTHKLTEDYLNGVEKYIESKTEQEEVIKAVMENVKVSSYVFDRVDVAIDTNKNFRDNFRFYDMLHSLVAYNEGKKGFFSTSKETYKKNSIKLNGSSFDFVIYDKLDERKKSRVKGEFLTRLEFRYKRRVISNFDIALNETVARLIGGTVKRNKQLVELEPVIENFEKVEDMMIEILTNEWLYDYKGISTGHTFSSFVRNNIQMFYTRRVLQEVYKKSGLKGSFNKWLEKLRATYRKDNAKDLEFITKTDMNKFIKDVVRAIKVYKRS